MNRCIPLIALIIAITAAGCFSIGGGEQFPPPIASFKDPAFAGKVYRSLTVVVDTADLEWQHRMEKTVTYIFGQRRLAASAGYAMFIPTRSWSDADRRATLAKNGVDAYLRFTVDKVIVNDLEVPPKTTTTTKVERTPQKSMTGDTVQRYSEVETTSTTTVPGYMQHTVTMYYRAALIDVATGQTAWIGLNRFVVGSGEAVDDFADRIGVQLVRDSMVVRSAL